MATTKKNIKFQLENLSEDSIKLLQQRIKEDEISSKDALTLLTNILRIIKEGEFEEEEDPKKDSEFQKKAEKLLETL